MLLQTINSHPRDAHIVFQEEGHIYTINNNPNHPTSVTTLIHNWFPQFNSDMVIRNMMKGKNWKDSKYYGKTAQQIKDEWEANGKAMANLGTLMHADIERYLNSEPVLNSTSVEFNYFLTFWQCFQQKNPTFKPFRTEWLVYDEEYNIAGSIDGVLQDEYGRIVILDWKRSKEIKLTNKYEKGIGVLSSLDNCNYNHYTLQLNIYRHILETKYNKTVVLMMIVVFHPDNDKFLTFPISHFDVASIWHILTAKKH